MNFRGRGKITDEGGEWSARDRAESKDVKGSSDLWGAQLDIRDLGKSLRSLLVAVACSSSVGMNSYFS